MFKSFVFIKRYRNEVQSIQQWLKFMAFLLLRHLYLFHTVKEEKMEGGQVTVHRAALQSVDHVRIASQTHGPGASLQPWQETSVMPLTGSLFLQDSQCSCSPGWLLLCPRMAQAVQSLRCGSRAESQRQWGWAGRESSEPSPSHPALYQPLLSFLRVDRQLSLHCSHWCYQQQAWNDW